MRSTDLKPGQKEVILTGEPFEVVGPVDLDLVKVSYPPGDALVLGSGATGRIRRVEIDTRTEDGIKVQNANAQAAHDLTIEGGYVTAHGMKTGAHQDGIQVMGGRNLTFYDIDFKNFGTQGIFVNKAGSGATNPTDITFDGCRILDSDNSVTNGPASPVNINGSLRTKLLNCHVVTSERYKRAIVVGSAAEGEILQNNREYPIGTQLPPRGDVPVPPDPEPEPDPGTKELIVNSWELINDSSVAKKWQADNPGEWSKCKTYWDGGARPVAADIRTSFGNGLVALTDARNSTE